MSGERSDASSSEGGGEFECRVSTYLPSFFFFFWLIMGGKSVRERPDLLLT